MGECEPRDTERGVKDRRVQPVSGFTREIKGEDICVSVVVVHRNEGEDVNI